MNAKKTSAANTSGTLSAQQHMDVIAALEAWKAKMKARGMMVDQPMQERVLRELMQTALRVGPV